MCITTRVYVYFHLTDNLIAVSPCVVNTFFFHYLLAWYPYVRLSSAKVNTRVLLPRWCLVRYRSLWSTEPIGFVRPGPQTSRSPSRRRKLFNRRASTHTARARASIGRAAMLMPRGTARFGAKSYSAHT